MCRLPPGSPETVPIIQGKANVHLLQQGDFVQHNSPKNRKKRKPAPVKLLFVSGILREKAVCIPAIVPSSQHVQAISSDGLDLEVERDQAKHKGLQVLHQVVEHPQPLRIRRLAHVNKRSNLGRLQREKLVLLPQRG